MTDESPTIATLRAVCRVSKSTAYRWQKAPETIPPGYRALLDAHQHGRLIPESWQGFHFARDQLWTPIDKALNRSQAEQVAFFMQFWRNSLNENDLLRDYIDYLESVTPRAPVIPFPVERTRLSATLDHEHNHLFHKPTKEQQQ